MIQPLKPLKISSSIIVTFHPVNILKLIKRAGSNRHQSPLNHQFYCHLCRPPAWLNSRFIISLLILGRSSQAEDFCSLHTDGRMMCFRRSSSRRGSCLLKGCPVYIINDIWSFFYFSKGYSLHLF